MTEIFKFRLSERPLLVSIPHAGTRLSPGLVERLSAAASSLPDTDWFVDRLYKWAGDLGAGVINARYSRYVIDLNRPPDDASLYSGATTGLVPTRTFEGEDVYDHEAPSAAEIASRVEVYHRPYHDAIDSELQRMRRVFGYALLLDAHSICSIVPRLFKGQLPDLNLGSFDRRSADSELVDTVASLLASQPDYSHVTDGRFKGGYITRHYGRPHQGIHALQLEMAQRVYMHESPPRWDSARANSIRPLLARLLEAMLEWGDGHA